MDESAELGAFRRSWAGILKRLRKPAVVPEQANVVRHAAAALRDGAKAVQNAAVQLAGIGLTATAFTF